MSRSLALILILSTCNVARSASPVDLSNLPSYLQNISADILPSLQPIAVNVWNHPELSQSEIFAHDQVVSHFSALSGDWIVTPHAFGQQTAWSLDFRNQPSGFKGKLPVIGFMAEMDALPGIGHACGHNLILLNGIMAASLTRKVLLDHGIAAHVRVIGTPDEEQTAGKKRLLDAGAFNDGDVWLMAHPTITNAVQPMQARHNALLKITGSTHQEVVHKAFDQLVLVFDLNNNLTSLGIGTASSLTPTEDVGVFSSNVVQTVIQLGVVGATNIVNAAVADIKTKESSYAAVNYTISQDKYGNVVTLTGPGGHASEGTKGPLDLAIEMFRSLRDSSAAPPFAFYLPGNTSVTELDVTIDARTRYTIDLPRLEQAFEAQASVIPDSLTWDIEYKSLEVTPYFGQRLIDIMNQPQLGEVFVNSTVAPAATDAGWIQNPTIDPSTHALISESVPVFHPNYGICPTPSGAGCPFNHEAAFKDLAATDLAYSATEKMARALAQIAVELAADPERMVEARALVK